MTLLTAWEEFFIIDMKSNRPSRDKSKIQIIKKEHTF